MAETSLMAVAGSLTANVEGKVSEMLKDKRLDLPADYSYANALKSAQLAIMEVKDRNQRPALQVCTKESVIQSMLSMVVQGLNPDKKQAYFICYGTKLTLMRSYFGDIAVAKRVDPNVEDIVAQVVYKGEKDNFRIEVLPNGKMLVTQHIPDVFGSRTRNDIIGAYATVTYKDGTAWSEFRTMEQIKEAWKHSQRNPINDKGEIKEGTTHYTETEDMCRRTVVKRACKQIINASSDSNLVAQFARETEREMEKAEAEERIDSNLSQGDVVDIPDFPDAEEVEVVATYPSDEAKPTEAVGDNGQPTETVGETTEAPKRRGRPKKEETAMPEIVDPSAEFADVDNPFANI